jgi:hypothetical protein
MAQDGGNSSLFLWNVVTDSWVRGPDAERDLRGTSNSQDGDEETESTKDFTL